MALSCLGIRPRLKRCWIIHAFLANTSMSGKSGTLATEPIASPYYQMQSSKDWLEGSFEDLMDLGRLGLSYKEPSLYLVDPARKQEKQNIEKT